MCISISLIPFLKFIVKINKTASITDRDLVIYYLLFLVNTILPYLTAQYSILLSASQKARIKHNITLFSNVLLQLVHIAVLVLFKSYYFYIIATVCITLFTCVTLALTTRRRFRRYFYDNKIVAFDKGVVKNKVLSTVLYKFGAVAVNNTDNILISVLVSTAAVGYYSNYCTITSSIQGMIAIVSVSLLSGLGNLYATSTDNREKKKLFYFQLFSYHTIAAIGFIGLFLMLDKFIILWIGSKYVLGKSISFAIAFNFYITNATGPIWINREANGLFERVKYLMIVRALLNLVLSILLGRIYGTFGILFATGLSIILSSFWVEPRILFEHVFSDSPRGYWMKQAKYLSMTIVTFCFFVFMNSYFKNGIVAFALEVITIISGTLLVFMISVWRCDEGKFIRHRLKGFVLKYKQTRR